MERKERTLRFEPNERGRFFRAITLVGKVFGFEPEILLDTIEHEKAHINEAERLGHVDKIYGYSIRVAKRCRIGIGSFSFKFGRDYLVASVLLDDTRVSNQDMVRVALAPIQPSSWDFYKAMRAFGFKEECKRIKEGKYESDEEYRKDLLKRANNI